jgi:methyl-accepting chemotaxis protein
LGEVQKELGCKVVSTIRSQISALVAMNDKCSHAAHDISGSSAKISRDVHEIVVALQFQDITRQQMEHATEALVNMRSSLEANAVKAGEAAEICALQSAQLVHSSDELLSAVARIAVTLKTVARESEAITAGAHALFQQADLMGHASVESIEHGLNTIATAFSENIDTNRKLIEIMRGVSDDLGEINTFAEDIDYIGSEIRLIALNAIIMAAQAGEAGAGFSVIAQTVKQQSEDICRQAAAITTSIHAITDHVAELQAFLTEDGEGEAEGSGADKRRGELEKAIVRLNEVTCNATDILSRTDEASERLASLIGEALSALESRDVARTLKGEVIPRLDRLVATLSAGNNDISQGDGIARLNRRYTMESERNIHRRFAVITPASAGGNREVAASTNDASGKDGLGDNVEFF